MSSTDVDNQLSCTRHVSQLTTRINYVSQLSCADHVSQLMSCTDYVS